MTLSSLTLLSRALSIVCIAASMLIMYDDNKWFARSGDAAAKAWSGWKSNTIKDKDPEPRTGADRPSDRVTRWGID